MLDLLWCSGLCVLIIILLMLQWYLRNSESLEMPKTLSSYCSSCPHGGNFREDRRKENKVREEEKNHPSYSESIHLLKN